MKSIVQSFQTGILVSVHIFYSVKKMFFDSMCNHQIKISEYRYTCGFSGENFLSVVLTRDTVKELLLQIKNLDAKTVNFRLAQKED